MYSDMDRHDIDNHVLAGTNNRYRGTDDSYLLTDLSPPTSPNGPLMSGSTDTGFAHIQLAAHSLLRPEAGLSPLHLPREEEVAQALLDLCQQQAPVVGDGGAAWGSHGHRASRMPTGHANPLPPSVPPLGDCIQDPYRQSQGDGGRRSMAGDGGAAWGSHGHRASCMPIGHANPLPPSMPPSDDHIRDPYQQSQGDWGRRSMAGDGGAAWGSHGHRASCMPIGHANPLPPSVPPSDDHVRDPYQQSP